MCGLVCVQIRLLVESLVATRVRAREGFFTCVDAHVSFQVEVEGKLLSTLLALIGFFSGVHKHVSLELSVV